MNDAPLWSGLALVSALGARVVGPMPREVGGVSIDTRTLAPGDLFVAICGDNSDGHDHVASAFAGGAAAAVVDEAHAAALREAGPLYVVTDTLAALEGLAVAARARTGAHVVAVTGSVGKTGVKEALRLVFAQAGPTHASVASYNNHWGVPLTLARMPQLTRFGVFEIGMNHAGEITPLVGMARPHVAIVTTIAPVHLEHFASLEAIAQAKAEIFSGLEPDGVSIVNADVAQFPLLRDAAARRGRVLRFGEREGADARLLLFEADAEGAIVEADVLGRRLRYRLAAPGRHLATNSLAILLAAEACGVSAEQAAATLGGFSAPKGRGERVRLFAQGAPFTLIDESYNANPTSMRAALALVGDAKVASPARRIVALGDMLELGPAAERLHRDLEIDVSVHLVDKVFAAGPLMRALFDALPEEKRGAWAERSADIEDAVLDAVGPGDVVMVKGSNGSRMGRIVDALKTQFAAPAQNAAAPEAASC